MDFALDLSMSSMFVYMVWLVIILTLFTQFLRSIRLVPNRSACIVERLGKYHKTLEAGFHTLLPFIDKVTFVQDLKEESLDVPPQDCFTKDNVRVEVDAVIYIQITDPVKASYGVGNYKFAATQLAQTTTRSVIGTLDLDKTFEERALISSMVVKTLEEAGQTWGIKVNRYEVKNITPPASVRDAMERQVTAERERRAVIANSEGVKQSKINRSEGKKMELINLSEGEMQKIINESEGMASEVLSLATATAESIEKLGRAISTTGGDQALNMQLSQKYLDRLSALAKKDTKVLLPVNLAGLSGLLDGINLNIKKG